jgi:signal transduction histidine kinase
MDAIQNAVLQISNEDYRVLLPNDMNDSLGTLEKGLNTLAGKIQDGLSEQAEFEQAKNDFIVNIAHDLRTPLTSIIGYLALLSEEQINREISAKYASIAFEKSKQLENTVEALFDIAAFAMENVRLSKQEINLLKFLTQKQDEMYPQLSEAEMEIRIDIPETMPAIIVDGDLMARVMDNIIINAIRYAKAGKYIDIIAKEQDKNILISFVTYANPIPAAELERIFDKFYRLEKSRALSTGGSGLGLSISRRIVELHGGTLTARQTPDGTAFDICLPNLS